VARKGRPTRCCRERIPTTTESAIRARFVRDSFHSLSTGAPTAFSEAWRACLICPICPLRSGERPRCDVGWAALDPRWLGSKIGRALGYFIGPSRRCRRRRILSRGRAFFRARGLLRSTVRPKTAAPIFVASVASFTGMYAPGTWKPMMQLRRYAASHRVPGNGNRASDCQLPVRRGVCGPWWERVSCVHRDVRAAQGALLERMTRPERAARSLVCYPLRVSLRSPQRGG
jgi:hypothetical protein